MTKEKITRIVLIACAIAFVIICALLFYFSNIFVFQTSSLVASIISSEQATPRISHTSVLSETSSPEKSSHNKFWLNSGGLFYLMGQKGGRTIQGKLPPHSFWRVTYSFTNPSDSEQGFRPQNIFRLLTKLKVSDTEESVYVKVTGNTLSMSESQNESNGIFLMSRYSDPNNLYYAGIRVDGNIVIKKKENGIYTTLALVPFYEGYYDRDTKHSLIPEDTWIGLRSRTYEVQNIATAIELFIDEDKSGSWKKVLTAYDIHLKSPARVKNTGFTGIRSDFMDLEIDLYEVKKI